MVFKNADITLSKVPKYEQKQHKHQPVNLDFSKTADLCRCVLILQISISTSPAELCGAAVQSKKLNHVELHSTWMKWTMIPLKTLDPSVADGFKNQSLETVWTNQITPVCPLHSPTHYLFVLLYLHINLSFKAHEIYYLTFFMCQTVPFYEPTLRLSVSGLFSIYCAARWALKSFVLLCLSTGTHTTDQTFVCECESVCGRSLL